MRGRAVTLKRLDDGTYEWTDPTGVVHPLRSIHGRICEAKGIAPRPAWLLGRHAPFIEAERNGTMPQPRRAKRAPQPPDPAAVEAARKRAEERGVAWVMHGATGLARWWMRIGRATQDVAAARLAVCYECPQFNRACAKCSKCGCGLRAKVSDVREVCPLGKW